MSEANQMGRLENKIEKLEEADKSLLNVVSKLDNRVDLALLTLSHNVSSLTDAVRDMKESTAQQHKLQEHIIVLQEKALMLPKLESELNDLRLEFAENMVTVRALRWVTGALFTAMVGALAVLILS